MVGKWLWCRFRGVKKARKDQLFSRNRDGRVGRRSSRNGRRRQRNCAKGRSGVCCLEVFQSPKVRREPTIYCKCCGAKVVVGGGGGNTSNLPRRLNRKHVMEHQECVRLRSASTTSSDASEMVKPKLSRGAARRRVCLGDEQQTSEGDFEIQ